MSLRIAIVGCGKIADGHVEEIQKLTNGEQVVAVCDREILMAEQMAARYNLPAYYDSFERMLDRERPDVVHITTPPESHLALTRTAVDAGCHVYVEKPLALNHADAEALVDYVAKSGKKMTIGYTFLFDPPALEMRRLIEEGELGEIVHVESYFGYSLSGQFGAALLGDAGHWVHRLPGKLFHNNIDHLLNKLTEFVDDENPRITATAWRRRESRYGDVRDDLMDELRLTLFGERVSAYGTFSSHVSPATTFVRLYGSKNIAHVDYVTRTVTLEPGARLPSAIGRLVPAFGQAMQFARVALQNSKAFAAGEFQFFQGLRHLFKLFYASITDGAPPPISTRDMLRISRWMDQIFAQINQPRGGRS